MVLVFIHPHTASVASAVHLLCLRSALVRRAVNVNISYEQVDVEGDPRLSAAIASVLLESPTYIVTAVSYARDCRQPSISSQMDPIRETEGQCESFARLWTGRRTFADRSRLRESRGDGKDVHQLSWGHKRGNGGFKTCNIRIV